MHPDDATCQALLDGELSPSVCAEVAQHLAGCAACRRNLAELEYAKDEVSDWLDRLVSKPPRRSAEAIRQRARPGTPRRRYLVAASMLLVIATAAGATIHSRVLYRLLGWPAAVERITTPHQGVTTTQAASPVGIALHPRDALEVRFDGPQREGTIRISFSDPPIVSIVASAGVPYEVEQGRVTIANQDAAANYTITLPRTLPVVVVRVGHETVFRKVGGSISAASVPDAAGEYLIAMSAPAQGAMSGSRERP